MSTIRERAQDCVEKLQFVTESREKLKGNSAGAVGLFALLAVGTAFLGVNYLKPGALGNMFKFSRSGLVFAGTAGATALSFAYMSNVAGHTKGYAAGTKAAEAKTLKPIVDEDKAGKPDEAGKPEVKADEVKADKDPKADEVKDPEAQQKEGK